MEVQLSNQQVAQACKATIEMFNTDGVMIPSKWALGGDAQVLQGLLMSLATGQCVIVNAPKGGEVTPPDGDGGEEKPRPSLSAVGDKE